MTRLHLALPWEIDRSVDGRTMHICDASGRRLFKVLPAGEAFVDLLLDFAEGPRLPEDFDDFEGEL